MILDDNYFSRLPGYVVSAYSRLKRLSLRNNQIESMPTLSKSCSIFRFLEHLDLGENRLKLFPTSFVMCIGHGDSTDVQGRRSPTQSNLSATSEMQNSISMHGVDDFKLNGTGRKLTKLKALYLDGNLLETIPVEIVDHEELSILHLQNNRLT